MLYILLTLEINRLHLRLHSTTKDGGFPKSTALIRPSLMYRICVVLGCWTVSIWLSNDEPASAWVGGLLWRIIWLSFHVIQLLLAWLPGSLSKKQPVHAGRLWDTTSIPPKKRACGPMLRTASFYPDCISVMYWTQSLCSVMWILLEHTRLRDIFFLQLITIPMQSFCGIERHFTALQLYHE